MKKLLFFRKGLFIACMIAAGGLLLSSCSKDELTVDPAGRDDQVVTKASAPDGHWRCRNMRKDNTECGFLNPGWRDKCVACDKSYNSYHGGLLVTFFQTILKNYVDIETGATDINESNIRNRIIIPGGILLQYAPASWYESAKAQRYYTDLKTLGYYSDPKYAEGVDLGWYRTVRMLYPGISDKGKVEREHTRWVIGDGRFMKDSNGRGLKDGTNAAVKAFLVN